ncbi:MAG TPA: helix-turn-helix domain-containing protein [Thermoanaerobaculia bacterium]|nr:helix-turn-helix domain-containing protein [Thermoanaerobaculia bacterium]
MALEKKALLTTTEVAVALGVGVSSIKRWTNEGRLESTKTVGGHRRYALEAVHRFAGARGFPVASLPPLESPPTARSGPMSADEIRGALLTTLQSGDAGEARALIGWSLTTLAERASFLDRVIGEAMRLIGEGWAEGEWSVDQEHRASHIVAEVLDRMRPEAPPDPGARRSILAAPPGELHDLPLRMIRLVFEWNGWRTEYYGADVPWEALEHAVARGGADLVALTARSGEPFEREEFRALVRECQARGVRVAAGGEWARGGARRPDGYARIRTLHGFQSWLRREYVDR